MQNSEQTHFFEIVKYAQTTYTYLFIKEVSISNYQVHTKIHTIQKKNTDGIPYDVQIRYNRRCIVRN